MAAMTYAELEKYTGGAYKVPAGVNPNTPTTKSQYGTQVTPEAQDYLLNYVSSTQGISRQEAEAMASQVPSLNGSIPQATYQPSTPTYEELLADSQAFTAAEVEKATAPLLQTIQGLQNQLSSSEQYRQSEATRQLNTSRSQAGGNLLIEPASTRTTSSSADAFKIRGRTSATGTPLNEVLPAAVNI